MHVFTACNVAGSWCWGHGLSIGESRNGTVRILCTMSISHPLCSTRGSSMHFPIHWNLGDQQPRNMDRHKQFHTELQTTCRCSSWQFLDHGVFLFRRNVLCTQVNRDLLPIYNCANVHLHLYDIFEAIGQQISLYYEYRRIWSHDKRCRAINFASYIGNICDVIWCLS